MNNIIEEANRVSNILNAGLDILDENYVDDNVNIEFNNGYSVYQNQLIYRGHGIIVWEYPDQFINTLYRYRSGNYIFLYNNQILYNNKMHEMKQYSTEDLFQLSTIYSDEDLLKLYLNLHTYKNKIMIIFWEWLIRYKVLEK